MRLLVLLCLTALAGTALAEASAGCDPDGDSKAFTRCRVCHASAPGAADLSGPNLWNVVGRDAGTGPRYRYSTAVVESGLTWNEQSLREYLANPSLTIPGTRMASAPISDPDTLDAIICHLHTLQGD